MAEPSLGPPLRVAVQAGTLSRLVSILVHGLQGVAVAVADDNGEMSLREGKTRDLVVDQQEFAKVWWSSFRSFVTPFGFFEVSAGNSTSIHISSFLVQLLRKLYVNSQPRDCSPSVPEYISLIAARSEVLAIIKEWFNTGGGAQDALDDPQLCNTVQSFLDSTATHAILETSTFQDPSIGNAWRNLEQTIYLLTRSFNAQTQRPTRPGHFVKPSPLRSRSGNGGKEAPDVDRISAEELVDNLDDMASAAFSNVTEEVRTNFIPTESS
jgi:hypothetical protein